jgi:prepilin-type N-terminal cleavage/methylation domain-containing protein
MKKFFLKQKTKNKKGMSLIEVIIASAIISISMISITQVYGNFLTLSLANTSKVQSVFLLDEGVEAMKTIRNYSWASIGSLATNTNYYLVWQNSRWQATTTPVIIDNQFVRQFTVQNVYRDPTTLNIVYTGGVLNNDSKMINMNVSWNYKGATSTKQTSFYIFNLYE